MNVHLLCHLVDCVTNWGPLWAYSCFTFESFNGQLKSISRYQMYELSGMW